MPMQIQCHDAKLCVRALNVTFPNKPAITILKEVRQVASHMQNAKRTANCKIQSITFHGNFKKSAE
jgi:hypothetical protein